MRFVVAALLAPVIACAQAEPDQRLVKFNVVATTSKGEPVTDLNASDIRIKEDGKLRPVEFFRFAGRKTAPTVILLDRWNERLLTTATSWSEVRKGLQAVHPGDPVYLYLLNNAGTLVPIGGFPGPEDLFAETNPSPARLIEGLDKAIKGNQGFRSVDASDPGLRIERTLRALTELGVRMASFDGRKNLIWVTHGIPLQFQALSGDWIQVVPELRRVAATAAQSQIAIYPVDQSAQGVRADALSDQEMGLKMVAAITGGRWYSSNSSAQAIADSMNDARNYYTIAYYSPIALQSGAHKIRLESGRKGVRFLTRQEYDVADSTDADGWPETLFRGEAHSVSDAFDIGVRVASVSRDPSTKAVSVELRVNPMDLLMDQSGGDYLAHLTILPALYRDGALQGSAALATLDVHLTPAQFDAAAKDGISISQTLPPDDSDTVRFMVFDRTLHSLGSATIKLP